MKELSREFIKERLEEIFSQAGSKDIGEKLDRELNKYDISQELKRVLNAQIAYYAEEAYRQGYLDGTEMD